MNETSEAVSAIADGCRELVVDEVLSACCRNTRLGGLRKAQAPKLSFAKIQSGGKWLISWL